MPHSAPSAHSATLNPAQRQAAESGVTFNNIGGPPAGPPLAVIAGAGTGKTTTLAHRVANLIVAGADPARLLLLTFSRRAAQEMTRRARQIVRDSLAAQSQASSGRRAVALPWTGTFHSVANRLLRMYAARIGLNESFSILDRSDAADLLNVCRSDLGLAKTRRRFPTKHACIDIYSRVVNSQQPLEPCLQASHPWCLDWQGELKQLFGAYVALKQESNCLDYDDLLLYWFHATQDADIALSMGGRFDFILVDEYQDTNVLQAGILRAMKPDGDGVTIVGDDAQSIYGFRAATVDNILQFPDAFSPPAQVVKLTQNYRSQPAILDFANALMAQSSQRYDKDLVSDLPCGGLPQLVNVESEDHQVQYVVEAILMQRERGVQLRDQAVLFRNSHHSDLLELELTRRNIPYVKYGGLKFLEAAHVKDFVATMRWLGNPRDRVAAFRVLMLLPGVGPGRAAALWAFFQSCDYRFDELSKYKLPDAAAQRWRPLCTLLGDVAAGRIAWPDWVEPLFAWYRPYLDEKFATSDVRAADLEQLVSLAARRPSCEEFVSALTLDPPSASSDLAGPPHIDDDYLILSTVHSAKGQEWDSVYLLNVVDGTYPSEFACGDKQQIEEERRLLYVAVTRARNDLRLIQPLKFYVTAQQRYGARYVYAAASRFLTDELRALCRCKNAANDDPGDPGSVSDGGVIIDLPGRLRELW